MNSKKITTNNPLMNPDKINQKYLTVAQHNLLHEDVSTIENNVTNLTTIVNNLPTGDTLVTDWGIGAMVIAAATNNNSVIQIYEDGPDHHAYIRLVDLINSVHYASNGILEYSYSDDAGQTWSVPVTDPATAIINWFNLGGDACNYLGSQVLTLLISDGSLQPFQVDVNVIIQDNLNLCGN